MKRSIFIALLTLVMVAMMGFTALAAISTTQHNLSTSGTGAVKSTNETQICIFCHTPHGANPAVPLWNRAAIADTPSFNPYASTTLQGTVDTTPAGGSELCLSCHDGTVAINNISNTSSMGTPTMATASVLTNGMLNSTSVSYLGRDLSNDHPVSVTYRADLDTGLRAPTTGTAYVDNGAGYHLPLFGSAAPYKVQCGSCHNAHDNTNGAFLRASNDGSKLCLTCHTK